MVIERVYNVPLRKGFKLTARYKKTKKAVSVLKEFLSRHMKQPDLKKVYVGKNLNLELWKHGIKNPPGQVKITVIKEDNGDVKAELYGFKYAHKKKDQKEEKAEKADKKGSKSEEKSKDDKKKSTSEDKHEHKAAVEAHTHEHPHDEKHEHAHVGSEHEHAEKPVVKTSKKPAAKKKAE